MVYFVFHLIPLFLGSESVAVMQQEAVGRREVCLGEEFTLLFPAEFQSQGRACTASVTWAPACSLSHFPSPPFPKAWMLDGEWLSWNVLPEL